MEHWLHTFNDAHVWENPQGYTEDRINVKVQKDLFEYYWEQVLCFHMQMWYKEFPPYNMSFQYIILERMFFKDILVTLAMSILLISLPFFSISSSHHLSLNCKYCMVTLIFQSRQCIYSCFLPLIPILFLNTKILVQNCDNHGWNRCFIW